MRYDEKEFWNAVEGYKKAIDDVKGKSFMIIFDINNEKAFYSIAPLSRAIHERGGDINAVGINKKSDALDALNEVYETYQTLKEGKTNKKTEVLIEFIK